MRTIFALAFGLVLTAPVWAQSSRPADLQLKAALHKEQVEGDLKGAIRVYEDVVKRYPGERAVAARALLGMAACYEKLGQAEARKMYERILREYSDQATVFAEARTRLGALGQAPRNGEVVTRLLWDKAIDTWGTTSADGRFLTFPDWETGDLGLRDLRLITNNPEKRAGLEGYGLRVVERVSVIAEPNPHNLRYLETKRTKMGHLI